MPTTPDRATARIVAAAAHPLGGGPEDFGPLLDLVGDARIVLLGEAELPETFPSAL